MWPMQQQQPPQPSVSVVTTVWGVASTTSQAQLPTDNMLPSIPTSNTGQVMNQQPYGNSAMMNAANKPYQQSGRCMMIVVMMVVVMVMMVVVMVMMMVINVMVLLVTC
jgi:cobalamin biosynthesis Mg chelatase CobN